MLNKVYSGLLQASLSLATCTVFQPHRACFPVIPRLMRDPLNKRTKNNENA
ncbi:MAG: hypothetical protein LBF08_05955 [Dysgonamonadaceae bacterium]|jgi:hypothetical protein|nr:hypothetical protein [Dysgonamonadaceae bacterium]